MFMLRAAKSCGGCKNGGCHVGSRSSEFTKSPLAQGGVGSGGKTNSQMPNIRASPISQGSSVKPGSASGKAEGTPFRHPLGWQDPDFYDPKSLDKEMRRVFDICAGCRLCFNLCNSFPKLFELVDKAPTQDLDSVPSSKFKSVVDDCTLCDLCFIQKCPYVPPHAWNIDFPHLMLRYRAVENMNKNLSALPASTVEEINNKHNPVSAPRLETKPLETQPTPPPKKKEHVQVDRTMDFKPESFIHEQMVSVDRVGPIATSLAKIFNWAVDTGAQPRLVRQIMESTSGVHHRADLPKYVPASETFMSQSASPLKANPEGPSFGKRKVVLYSTCLVNYNKPGIGMAARAVLAHTGVEVQVAYPECCGMPQLESGNIADVTKRAKDISAVLNKYIDQGYEVVTLVASCGLMLKQEWPNFLPQDEEVKKLSSNTSDISEYVVKLAKAEGLIPGMQQVDETISLHFACHSRAQNNGFKARDMLKMIPGVKLTTVERCSGHGGSWGVMKETFPTAMQVGKPVFTKVSKDFEKDAKTVVSSECPLAADHIKQGVREMNNQNEPGTKHPIELLAMAYKLL